MIIKLTREEIANMSKFLSEHDCWHSVYVEVPDSAAADMTVDVNKLGTRGLAQPPEARFLDSVNVVAP